MDTVRLSMKDLEIRRISASETWGIRHEVMWPDQAIDYVKLEHDEKGIHLGLIIKNKIISVISIFIAEDQAQFRKLATRIEEQGKGFGSMLLAFTLEYLKNKSVKKVWCNARKDKIAFYQKFNFHETGIQFSRLDKEYIIIEKMLLD